MPAAEGPTARRHAAQAPIHPTGPAATATARTVPPTGKPLQVPMEVMVRPAVPTATPIMEQPVAVRPTPPTMATLGPALQEPPPRPARLRQRLATLPPAMER